MTDQPWRQKQMVLIVDDDLASRELLANYLEPEGYAVVLASSGTEAIEEARRSLPDLIVTDVLMPGPGGLQTLFVLKNRLPGLFAAHGSLSSGMRPDECTRASPCCRSISTTSH